MKQGLLLDPVDMHRAGVAVRQRVELAVLMHAIAAPAPILRLEHALVGAKFTLNVPPQRDVMPGLLGPAAVLPTPPQRPFGSVVLEDRGGGSRLGQAAEGG